MSLLIGHKLWVGSIHLAYIIFAIFLIKSYDAAPEFGQTAAAYCVGLASLIYIDITEIRKRRKLSQNPQN